MVAALKMPARRMTVAEFLDWNPEDGTGRLWQLRDGEPEMMAPATDRHGSTQTAVGAALFSHLAGQGTRCRVVTNPGVVPHVGADHNMLIPDIGVTCEPPRGSHAMPKPIVLIEILSPSNEAETRANLWAYTTIPSVAEIVVIHSSRIGAELLRREANGEWPQRPVLLDADDELRLDCIAFAIPLRAAYVTSGLL
jgi:Uma2 family endonuclease